jgi:hypothetical protein
LVTLVLLAANLDGLELSRQGQALPEAAAQGQTAPLKPLSSPTLSAVFLVFLFVGVVIMPLLFLYVILSPESRKDLIRRLLPIIGFFALLVIARGLTNPEEQPTPEATPELQGESAIPETLGESAPPVTLEPPPEPPGWVVWLATLALGLVVAGILVGGIWVVWQRTQEEAPALEQLGQEAQEALEALQGGADLRDTIIRCYLVMSRILKRRKGLWRDAEMTPREFETSLIKAGLPDEQVRDLTRLFELARYGDRAPLDAEARQAVRCLHAIAEACRSAA